MDEELLALFADLPRQGPGDDAITEAVLAPIRPHLPDRPLVADMGCGTGRPSRVLARCLPAARIVALDLHPVFLAKLAAAARAEGLAGRLWPVCGDMAAPPLPPDSLDLIWSEGAAYSIGVARALALWRPLLRPGGWLVLSDMVWTTADPPDDLRQAWLEDGVTPATPDGLAAAVAQAGLELVATRPLPKTAWSEGYYRPMAARLPGVRNPESRAALAREIALFDRHGDRYGYLFVVARRR